MAERIMIEVDDEDGVLRRWLDNAGDGGRITLPRSVVTEADDG